MSWSKVLLLFYTTIYPQPPPCAGRYSMLVCRLFIDGMITKVVTVHTEGYLCISASTQRCGPTLAFHKDVPLAAKCKADTHDFPYKQLMHLTSLLFLPSCLSRAESYGPYEIGTFLSCAFSLKENKYYIISRSETQQRSLKNVPTRLSSRHSPSNVLCLRSSCAQSA